MLVAYEKREMGLSARFYMTTNLDISINQIVVPAGQSILLKDISWQKFEDILLGLGQDRRAKIVYDRGTLEIMVPLPEHEYFKEAISDLIKDLADELGMEYESYGSTTWRRQRVLGGAEPDNCFYFQNVAAIRDRLDIDLNQDPPPDLVLEIDITSSSLDSLPIYARLEVSEVWRYDRRRLRIYQLVQGTYVQAQTSLAFPGFVVQAIPDFINKNLSLGRRALRQSFRVWVRQQVG